VEVAYIAAVLSDKLHQRTLKPLLSESRQTSWWTRPSDGVLKLNFDGAFLMQTGEGGWGFIIRNHMGAVHKVGAGREMFVSPKTRSMPSSWEVWKT
jgi:hypothetical protein